MAIEIGMTMPTMLHHDRNDVLQWCRAIDEGPWSTLAVPERITYTSHSQIPELAAASVLTERVRLCTTIIILPAHPAGMMAKHLATIDRMCDGRLTVGVGVGGREHDYRAIDGRFDHRWQRMDDQIATMRRIWAGEAPFEGADPVGPPPVQPGGPPLVAGVMGPKALARAAKWAVGVDDATAILGVDVDALAAARQRVRDAWKDAGRSEEPHFSTSVWYALGPDARDQLKAYVYEYLKIFDDGYARMAGDQAACFTPEALREAVAGAAEAGCDELFLVPTTADPAELLRTREALSL